MKPVVVIENDPLLPGAGWVGRVLDERGISWRYLHGHAGELDRLTVDECSALVPMGGRPHAWDEAGHPHLRRERELLSEAVARDVPVLGCCLGGQVLARALGATVRPAPPGEHGWITIRRTEAAAADPLFGDAPPEAPVYLWHSDAFEVPDGAVVLAETDAAVQAFRVGRAWGLQFHPEVDLETFGVWHDAFPDACAAVGLDQAACRATAAAREDDQSLFVRRMIEAFADVVSAG